MNNRLSLTLVFGLAVVALATWTALASEEPAQGATEAIATSTFHVIGMTCGGCEVGVRRVVGKLEGIDAVEASHDEGTATVTYRPDKVTPGDIIAAIEELGYSAELALDEQEGT